MYLIQPKNFPNNTKPNLNCDKFVTLDFPPSDDSIFALNIKTNLEKKKKEFKQNVRSKYEYKNKPIPWAIAFLLEFEISKEQQKENIIQGKIGNCYLISHLHQIMV